MGGQELIVVRAKTTYLDIFQKRHWIHTCRILSASGEVGPHITDITTMEKIIAIQRACLSYNAIDPKDEQYRE
jgi:hypothetical protein